MFQSANPKWGQCFLVVFPISSPQILVVNLNKTNEGTFYDGKDVSVGTAQFDLRAIAGNKARCWNTSTGHLAGLGAQGSVTISVREYVDPIVTVLEVFSQI